MKNLFWGVLLVFFGSYQLNAQKKDTKKQNFDHWSIDLGAGIHQLGQNLSLGYDNDPLFQGNFGVRYMFNEKFGLRADLGYNSFKEAGDSNPFQSNLYRVTSLNPNLFRQLFLFYVRYSKQIFSLIVLPIFPFLYH